MKHAKKSTAGGRGLFKRKTPLDVNWDCAHKIIQCGPRLPSYCCLKTHSRQHMPSMPSLGALVSDETSNAMLEAVGLDGEDEELELYEQPPPGPSLGQKHSVDDKTIGSLTADQKQEAARCLRLTTMFKFCSDESIARVVDHMRREEFSEGEVGRCMHAIQITATRCLADMGFEKFGDCF